MPVGSSVIASGRYTVTWNSVSLGIMEGDAGVPTIEVQTHHELINSTDAYGKSTIGAIYQGQDVYAQMTTIEWIAGVRAAFWPYASTVGEIGVIGRELTDLGAALVLTAIASTPAASVGYATITATEAFLAPNYNFKILFGPTLRKVPLRFQLLPYTSTQDKWFVTT